VPRILKDCFGTVISSLNKMKECVRCELLSQCRAINWTATGNPPVVFRRPPGQGEGESERTPSGAADPGAAGGSSS